MKKIEFANKYLTEQQAEHLTDVILNAMAEVYVTANGEELTGVGVSELRREYVNREVRGVGTDFDSLIEALGFRLVENARNWRGQKVVVVTV